MKTITHIVTLTIVIAWSFVTAVFADEAKTVKVFVLAGQSNMEGKASNPTAYVVRRPCALSPAASGRAARGWRNSTYF